MAQLGITINPTILIGGGPITSDVFKSSAVDTWTKGTLLKVVNGLLEAIVDTSGGNVALTTTDTGTSNARLFVALEDHLTAGTEFVSVQAIGPDTVFEAQILSSGEGDARAEDVTIDGVYAGLQINTGGQVGSGLWGVDADVTVDGPFIIHRKSDAYNWADPKSQGQNAKVYVKLLPSIFA